MAHALEGATPGLSEQAIAARGSAPRRSDIADPEA